MRTLKTTLAVLAAVIAVPATANAMTVGTMVKRAHGNPFRCNHGSASWTVRENQCVAKVVFKRERWLHRQVFRIIRCESNWNEREVNGSSGASGLAQFLRSTWRNLPRFYSRHSVFHPVWNLRGMRYLRMHDGSFRQWVCQ
jgi:hypothetical protein